MVRKQQDDARAKQPAVTEADLQSQQLAKELLAKANLTPLIPPAALQPPRAGPRSFAPVSNLLAIERAKAKVQQLRAEKMAQLQQMRPKASQTIPQTIAQTSTKGSARVAHTNQVPQVLAISLHFCFLLSGAKRVVFNCLNRFLTLFSSV